METHDLLPWDRRPLSTALNLLLGTAETKNAFFTGKKNWWVNVQGLCSGRETREKRGIHGACPLAWPCPAARSAGSGSENTDATAQETGSRDTVRFLGYAIEVFESSVGHPVRI
jgi:hypothetical protein